MKIIYTYHGLQFRIGGVLRYFYEIIKRIKLEHEIIVISKYSNSYYLTDILPNTEFFLSKFSFKGKGKLERWIQNQFLYKKLRKLDYDIIHHTGENPSIFKYIKSKPVVITIHDMIPELYPILRKRILDRKKCINAADHIICVSQNTKKDLLNIYPEINENKISVIYHGFDSQTYTYLPNIWGKYILYVGDRDGTYKNFFTFIKAASSLIIKYDIQVICTGSPFSTTETQFFKELGIKKQIISSGFVDEQSLHSLYFHALCFVYPSEYEGFGMPILEAFKNYCPVCLSNSSCFPEIAGDAAIYFDPYNTNSIKKAIESIICNEELRCILTKKGEDRLTQYSWDIAKQQTIDVYQSLKRK